MQHKVCMHGNRLARSQCLNQSMYRMESMQCSSQFDVHATRELCFSLSNAFVLASTKKEVRFLSNYRFIFFL